MKNSSSGAILSVVALFLCSLSLYSQAIWKQTGGPKGGNISVVSTPYSAMWTEVGGLLYAKYNKTTYAFEHWYAPLENYLDTMEVERYIIGKNYNAILRGGKLYGFYPDSLNPRVNTVPSFISFFMDTMYIQNVYFSKGQPISGWGVIRYATKKDFYLQASKEIRCSIEIFPRNERGEYTMLDYSAQNHNVHLCSIDSAGKPVWFFGYAPPGLFGDIGYPTTLDSQYIRWARLDPVAMFGSYPRYFKLLDGEFPSDYFMQALAQAGDTLYKVQFDTLGRYSILSRVYLPEEDDQRTIVRGIYTRNAWGIGSYYSADSGATWSRYTLPPRRGKIWMPDYSDEQGKVRFYYLYTSRLGALYNKRTSKGDTLIPFNEGLPYADIPMLDRTYQTVYAVTEAGDLFTTTDEGNSWNMSYIKELKDSSENITALGTFSDYVYVGTRQGLVLRAGDKGKSWSEPLFRTDSVSGTEAKPIFSFYKTQDTLFVSTSQGLYYSLYYGNVWTKGDAAMKGIRYWAQQGGRLYACIPQSSESGIALNRGFYESTDGGVHWQQQQMPEGVEVKSMCATAEYIFLGTNNGLYASNDRGKSWSRHTELFAAADSVIYDLTAIGNNVVAVAGKTVYHFKSSLTSGAREMRTGLRRRAKPQKLLIDYNTVYLGTSNNSVYKTQSIPLDVEQPENEGEIHQTNGIVGMQNDGNMLHLQLQHPLYNQRRVYILNVLGADVASHSVSTDEPELHIDISALASGMYYLSIHDQREKYCLPFVVTR